MSSPIQDSAHDQQRRSYQTRFYVGVVVLVLMAIPASLHSAAAIATLRNLPAEWLPLSLPLRQDFIRFADRFGVTDIVLVSWVGAELDDPSVDAVVDMLRPLTLESHAELPLENSFQKAAVELCDDEAPIDWVRSGTEIRDGLMAPPLKFSKRIATRRLSGTLIGPNDKQSCVMFSLGKSTGGRQRELLPMIRTAIADVTGLKPNHIAMVGGPVNGAAIDGEAIRTINRYSLPSSVLAAVLCWLCLRSVALTASVVGVATVGQGMSLAIVYYSGITMNAVLIVLPPLVFVLTVSSGIHLCNYYLDEIRNRPAPETRETQTAAAKEAMRQGVPPCLIATFTTVVGLGSLALVRLEPVRVFGIVGSISILGTLAMLIVILPGAMLWARPKTGEDTSPENRKAHDAFTARDSAWMRPRWIIAGFMIITTFASIGLSHLQTSVSVTGMFHPESELRQQYDWFERNIGATMSGDILLSFPRNDHDPASKATSLEELRSVIAVHAGVQKIPGVSGVMSSASFLPLPSNSGRLSAVARRAAIGKQLSDPESEVYRLGYVDKSAADRTWRISMRLFQTQDADPGSLIPIIESVANQAIDDRAVDDKSGPRPTVTATGNIVIVERTQQLLLRDLFNSFLAALAVISLLMIVFLRSIVGGLLSMIPNVIPTLLLFGTMGWLRSPLDIGSIMTASVALGIAVDDTVHLLARFRHYNAIVSDRRHAALAAMRQCGWAMLQTTVVCSLSMLVYAFSDFVPTRHFAVFMLVLLVVAWLGVSTLLPALMMTWLGQFFTKRV